jgi:glycosyltransferase involved in cell wall biosynthesis
MMPKHTLRFDPALGAGLRVCHLGKFYPPAWGGIETHLRTLARTQADLGCDVRVLCVNHRDRRGRDVMWQRFAATETVEERDGPVRLTRVGRQASVARFDLCLRLPDLLARLDHTADILHLHVPNPTMLLALAAVRTRLPLVVTYHSDVIQQKRLAQLLRPFESLVFRRAGALLASSPAYPAGSRVLQAYRDRLSIVPFGINLKPYLLPSDDALFHAEQLRRAHGEPLWLAVGRLVYYKGLQHAIRALASVPGRLLVIGEGPLGEDLRRLAQQVGVSDRVIWRGRVSEEELVGAYHAATALWFSSNSRSEAFGFVQVEAMASGCPVINTAIPASGVGWVSRHEETGLTVAVDDADALAAAANRLLREPGLRRQLAAGARDRACEEFSDLVMGERMLELYRGVLAGARSVPVRGPHQRSTWAAEADLAPAVGV